MTFLDTGNVFAHVADIDLTSSKCRRLWPALQVADWPDSDRLGIQGYPQPGEKAVGVVYQFWTGVLTKTPKCR